MSPFNQPKGIVAYGDMKVMLNFLDAYYHPHALSTCIPLLVWRVKDSNLRSRETSGLH